MKIFCLVITTQKKYDAELSKRNAEGWGEGYMYANSILALNTPKKRKRDSRGRYAKETQYIEANAENLIHD